MGWIGASVQWLKMAWATQPVLVVSCVMGALGKISQNYVVYGGL